MRYLFFTVFLFSLISFLKAQTGEDIIASLHSINKTVIIKSCSADSAAAISHRAMNVFLADKTGYLSGSTDLSYFTNYVTFNTDEGKFTVRHSFQTASGKDERLKTLFTAGAAMHIANSFSKSFLDNRYENELGITLSYTWLGKVKTHFADCVNNPNQKQVMDALRVAMLKNIEQEIKNKEINFKTSLLSIDTVDIPGLDLSAAKKIMLQNFYEDLKAGYEEKFATAQAAMLTKTINYKLISTHWTTLSSYIPLAFPTYAVATSLTSTVQHKHPYPFNLLLGHTRLWQSSKTGKIFFTLNAGLLFNNSKLTYGLGKYSLNEYKALGGTGAIPNSERIYIGNYETFLTPAVAARFLYFPGDSHVGISVLAEQNFGAYNAFNAKLGIPIVLINSKKTPAVNVECYVMFLNIGDKATTPFIQSNASLGLSIGIPFSRLMF